MSARDPEATAAQAATDHNTWVEDGRFNWCQRCFEATGIKRVMGEASFGDAMGIPTCPVCRGTRIGQPESRPQTAPDDFADRIAP